MPGMSQTTNDRAETYPSERVMMATLFSYSSTADKRTICKQKLESLEMWLRRLIDESLSAINPDYLCQPINGRPVLSKNKLSRIIARYRKDPHRFPAKIYATDFSHLIDIICHENLYDQFFHDPLSTCFPLGRQEAQDFLNRLIPHRNRLAHGHEISDRDAERLLCYSNDIIDSLKSSYERQGMTKKYNVPLILSVALWTGDIFRREQCQHIGGHIMLNLSKNQRFDCIVGDTITLEVEVDPAYEVSSYDIEWRLLPSGGNYTKHVANKFVVRLEEEQICEEFSVQCVIKGKNKKWYRLGSNKADDFLLFYVRVLPLT